MAGLTEIYTSVVALTQAINNLNQVNTALTPTEQIISSTWLQILSEVTTIAGAIAARPLTVGGTSIVGGAANEILYQMSSAAYMSEATVGTGLVLASSALGLSLTNASLNYISTGNPATVGGGSSYGMFGYGSTVTGQVAAPLGWRLAPVYSGRFLVHFSGTLLCTLSSDTNAEVSGFWGTGAGPVNNAAATGTQFTGVAEFVQGTFGGTVRVPFGLAGVITGLAVGTTVWFDLAGLETVTGSVTIISGSIAVMEF